TTCRRHVEKYHEEEYNEWCKENNFTTKLPKAKLRMKEAAKDKENCMKQARLDPHLREQPKKERVVPYTDKLFRDAAIQWLISQDMPIQALEHPKFKHMIDVASRATPNGVVIPNRKATRRHIMSLFKRNLDKLHKRLTVCIPYCRFNVLSNVVCF
ncbi:hypothetical protein CPC08DRAFT_628312, partial [Agrocybe pediades]